MKRLYSLLFFFASTFILNAQEVEGIKRFKLEYENGDMVISSSEIKGGQMNKQLTKSDKPYQDEIFGVFNIDEKQPNAAQIKEKGIAYVKFSATNGQAKRGDYLTSSELPGVAMKATKTGMTIGVALEDSNAETQLIKILVQPLWQTF